MSNYKIIIPKTVLTQPLKHTTSVQGKYANGKLMLFLLLFYGVTINICG